MTSSEDNDSAATGPNAVAEQLGNLSVNESGTNHTGGAAAEAASVGRRNETGAEIERFCSACGKSGTNLKRCIACKCVYYCDVSCQKAHRKEHKGHCREIKLILEERGDRADEGERLGPLLQSSTCMPPREECPICMRVLPIEEDLSSYATCCGQSICCGCYLEQERSLDAMNEERFSNGQPLLPMTCAFCREVQARSGEEAHERAKKRMELLDKQAMLGVALSYRDGYVGSDAGVVPVDEEKSVELIRQAADLGSAEAHYRLGMLYITGEMGVDIDEQKSDFHYKEAATGGHVIACHNLAFLAYKRGETKQAMQYWRLSASARMGPSINSLIVCFENAFIRHSDLAEVLQAKDKACLEMKSEARDRAIAILKEQGIYEELENNMF